MPFEVPELHLDVGEVFIPDVLLRFQDVFEEPLETSAEAIAQAMVILYKDSITSVGAVLSGRFRNTVRIRSATRRGDVIERIVASDMPYSGVIEEGWLRRAHGQESYPGRHPAERAVERALPVVRDVFETQFNRVGIGR